MTAPVTRLLRHTGALACPICGGNAALPKGRGIRCAGFTLESVAYCTREEYAGSLRLELQTEPPAYKHRLFGPCGCGLEHGVGRPAPTPFDREPSRPPYLPIADRHAIYSALVSLLVLRPPAYADLTRRGLNDTAIADRSYRSWPLRGREQMQVLQALVSQFGEDLLLSCPGFTNRNGELRLRATSGLADGYLVMYSDEFGRFTGLQHRILGGSYETARGTEARHLYHVAGLVGPGRDLYLTEGATKANVAHHFSGRCFFAVAGQSLTPEHVEVIRSVSPSRVIIALDQEDNVKTDQARERWARTLWTAGVPTYNAVWEGAELGGPKGIDDLFFASGAPRLRAVHFVPASFGEKRRLHETAERSATPVGVSLAEARRLVQDTVGDFIFTVGRRS